MALQEQLAEEEQEGRELESRMGEIRAKIDAHNGEMGQLKRKNSELQRKVDYTV